MPNLYSFPPLAESPSEIAMMIQQVEHAAADTIMTFHLLANKQLKYVKSSYFAPPVSFNDEVCQTGKDKVIDGTCSCQDSTQ